MADNNNNNNNSSNNNNSNNSSNKNNSSNNDNTLDTGRRDGRNRNADRLLIQAARDGDAGLARVALDQGARPDAATDAARSQTALHLAVVAGAAPVVELLLGEGADPGHDGSRQAPLHTASFSRSGPITALLLAAQADVNAGNQCQSISLHFACTTGSLEVATNLINSGAEVAMC